MSILKKMIFLDTLKIESSLNWKFFFINIIIANSVDSKEKKYLTTH